jgi:hypothetical protein
LKEKFTADYRKLFPLWTRLYFNGCNVAEGGDSLGWGFLETAGSIFLAGGGGQVFGHTSPGYAFPGWVPLVGSDRAGHDGSRRTEIWRNCQKRMPGARKTTGSSCRGER